MTDRPAILAQLDTLGFPSLVASLTDGAPLASVLADLRSAERDHDDNPYPATYTEARALVRAYFDQP